jgi:ABC-2 type transport system ATP-binding protein
VVDVIRTDALTKRFGATVALDGLDQRVPQGEVFGFLGPNGAGKTTTIRLLLDQIRPTSGRVEVLGLDARRDAVAIHARIGYLPGDGAMYPRMTGEDLVDLLCALSGRSCHEGARRLAARFDLDLTVPFRQLSKGNKQKVGIVQAFAHQPELAILDEPTGGLDPLVQAEFHAFVREVVAEGCTVFLSSHQLDEVQRVADRVGIIRAGRLVVVEDVGVLRSRAMRTVEIHLAGPASPDVLAGVPGVHDVVVSGDRVRCSVEGAMAPVLRAIAALDVVDLTSHEADLDQIFLQYYTARHDEVPADAAGVAS